MKNLLIVLLGFGLVGCATTSVDSVSSNASYESLSFHKAEAINTKTGETYFVGNVMTWEPADKDNKSISIAKVRAIELCDNSINKKELLKKYYPYPDAPSEYDLWRVPEVQWSKCKISRVNNEIYFNDLEEYKYIQEEELRIAKEKRNRQYELELETLKQQELEQIQKKEQKLTELIVRCKGYGFTGESNIAACVQREVQHDLELAQQEQRLQQLENRIASASKPTNDKPFFLEVLSILAEEAERQDELAQRVRLYELESEVSSLRSSKNVKQATCSLNRNC